MDPRPRRTSKMLDARRDLNIPWDFMVHNCKTALLKLGVRGSGAQTYE